MFRPPLIFAGRRALLLAIFAGLTLVVADCGWAAPQPDQSQLETPSLADYSDPSQSFVAGRDGWLTGISVALRGWEGPGGLGSDMTINVRAFSGGVAAGPVLATGFIARTRLTGEQLVWLTAAFDPPYRQTAGEALCFTIVGRTFGGDGFNIYAYAAGDLYPAGGHVPASYHFRDRDLAFQTLVDDQPPGPKVPPLPLPQAGTYTGTARSIRVLGPTVAAPSSAPHLLSDSKVQSAVARILPDGRIYVLVGNRVETAPAHGQNGAFTAALSEESGAYVLETTEGAVEDIVVKPRSLKFTYIAPETTFPGPQDPAWLRTRIVFTLTRKGL